MGKLGQKKGSAMVEAAVVIPVLFIIIAMFISMTLRANTNVGEICAGYEAETEKTAEADPMLTELTLRTRWLKERK